MAGETVSLETEIRRRIEIEGSEPVQKVPRVENGEQQRRRGRQAENPPKPSLLVHTRLEDEDLFRSSVASECFSEPTASNLRTVRERRTAD